MTRKAVFHDTGSFDDGTPITVFPAAVASVFGRTGTVAAAAGDYFGAMPAALTGATQAARFVGATTSGAPVSGTFAVGDVVVARDGKVWVCTVLGSPGTWVDVGGGASVSYATPAIVLGSSAAAGAASTVIRSDSTIAAFDATNPSTQAFGDAAAVGTAAFAARRDHKHAMPASPAAAIGSTALVYRYTVVGSDKANIDTGVDTADAGSNDWTNGDLLEVFIYARTDETSIISGLFCRWNNDSSSIYDRTYMLVTGTTITGGNQLAESGHIVDAAGATAAASQFSTIMLTFPNFAGTVGKKTGLVRYGVDPETGASQSTIHEHVGYRSTSALTRLKVETTTSGKKLKVGSQLLIYKRLAS